MAVVFVLGGAGMSFAQEGRFFGGNGITVFVDKDFRGNTQTFENDVPDLSSYGLDRRISSFRVGNNQEWQICDGKNYSGRCASVLGEEYDLSINGWNDRIRSMRRTNSSGGGWGSGGQNSTPPSWAQGTFYGNAPNGTQIILTIDRSGRVTANIGGAMSYGSYYQGYIIIDGNRSRLSQSGNGFRTVSTSNGESIYYSRNNTGGGWGGSQSRPPSWARGTFYGNAPNGAQIMLTINNDGGITANINGNISNGYYQSGNVININGNTARVYRQGDGFRTVSTMNNETIVYSRNSGGWGGSGGSNVPSWAIGQFRGNNPQDGSQIIMNIQSNGNVTINIGGNMNYGSLNGSTLTVNGARSTVYRNGNGIRTVSNGDGQTINYFRY